MKVLAFLLYSDQSTKPASCADSEITLSEGERTDTVYKSNKSISKLSEKFIHLFERLSDVLDEGNYSLVVVLCLMLYHY